MKKITLIVLAAALITLGAMHAKAAGKNDAPEQLFKAKCSACHSDEIALHMNKDRKGWEDTVKLMQKKKPNFISDQDARIIVDFLVSQSAKNGK